MHPGVLVVAAAIGFLVMADKKKKEEEARQDAERGGMPPPETDVPIDQSVPRMDQTPADDQGLPPLQPSPPYQAPTPPFHAPPSGRRPPAAGYPQAPPGHRPPSGFVPFPQPGPAPAPYPTTTAPHPGLESWRRATQDDVNRDGMLARYLDLMHSDRPIGSEVRVSQNGRLWKLVVVSHGTDPTTSKPRDVRGFILMGAPAAVPSPHPPHGYPRPAPPSPRPAPPQVQPPSAFHPSYPPTYPPSPHATMPAFPQHPGTYPPPHGYAAPYPPQPVAHAPAPPGPLPSGLPTPGGHPPIQHGPAYPTPAPGHPSLAFGAPAPVAAAPGPAVHGGAPAPTGECKNWVAATDADVKRDGVSTIYQSMLGMADRSEKAPEKHNGRWWKFKVVSKQSDPSFSFMPGATKAVRAWVCADSAGGGAAASPPAAAHGAIIGYMPAHNVAKLPDGNYTVFTHSGQTGLQPLASGNAAQVGAAYQQWKQRGGDPNSAMLVQQL